MTMVEPDEVSESSADEFESEDDDSDEENVPNEDKDRAHGTKYQERFHHINALKLKQALKNQKLLMRGVHLTEEASFLLAGAVERLIEVLWDGTFDMAQAEDDSGLSRGDCDRKVLKLRHLLKCIDV